jgi:diguanylate cyclase (GGDEF)-like protein
MKVGDLIRAAEEFRDALIAHRDLYQKSIDITESDYPVENEKKLREQSRTLSQMLGRLRPFFTRFRRGWLVREPSTGQTVDVLNVAVGMAHEVSIKAEILDHAIDGVEQVIGGLQRLDHDDEVPDDPKQPIRASKSPNRSRLLRELKDHLDAKTEVEKHNPQSDRGQKWLAKATALLRQVDPGLVPQFSSWADAIQLDLSSYTAGPIWKQMILMIRKAIADLESQVSTGTPEKDAVTGLLPRPAFEADFEPMVAQYVRRGLPLGVLVIDIDHFKSVNDALGHDIGDVVLRGVAGRIQDVIEGRGKAYRYGGEEIVVTLFNAAIEEAVAAAQRVRTTIASSKFELLDRPITVSVGVAVIPVHGRDGKTLFKAADDAVRAAKDLGRDRVEVAGHQ